MKRLEIEKIFIFIFSCILIFPAIFFIFFGFFLDWKDFKSFRLKEFYSGEFQEDFSDYFKDKIPFYNKIAALKLNMDILAGQAIFNGVFLQDNELIKISKPPTFSRVAYFCDALNKFFADSNKSIYYLIIPSKLQVNGAVLKIYSDVEKFNEIKVFLEKRLNSKIIELDDSALFESSKTINPFYKTIDSLNPMGAYILYSNNMKKLGQDAIDLQNFDIHHMVSKYYGNLYSKKFMKNVSFDMLDIFKYNLKDVDFNVKEIYSDGTIRKRNTIYDLSKINDFNKHNIVFGGNAVVKNVETSLNEKEKILIFADKYINNFMQFFSLHYKKITVVNLAYFSHLKAGVLNQIKSINLNEYDKVFFIYGIESLRDFEQFFNLKYFKN